MDENKVANNCVHPETCFCTLYSDLHDTYIILQTMKQLILVNSHVLVWIYRDRVGYFCGISLYDGNIMVLYYAYRVPMSDVVHVNTSSYAFHLEGMMFASVPDGRCFTSLCQWLLKINPYFSFDRKYWCQ